MSVSVSTNESMIGFGAQPLSDLFVGSLATGVTNELVVLAAVAFAGDITSGGVFAIDDEDEIDETFIELPCVDDADEMFEFDVERSVVTMTCAFVCSDAFCCSVVGSLSSPFASLSLSTKISDD